MLKEYAALYEKGSRENNEDAILLQAVHTAKGEVAIAAVCDGIGGLELGEVASSWCIQQIESWFYREFLDQYRKGIRMHRLKNSIRRNLVHTHNELRAFGRKQQVHLGTTVSVLLLYGNRYLLFHLGDSQVIRIGRKGCRRMTERHVGGQGRLTRCIGAGAFQEPQWETGWNRRGSRYLLASDGFAQKLSEEELMALGRLKLQRKTAAGKTAGSGQSPAKRCLRELAKRSAGRGEQDNMSAVFLAY